MTSLVASLIDVPYALCYRVPIGHKPINRLVSDIFSIKVADTRANTPDTSTDNKGRLKLAVQEPQTERMRERSGEMTTDQHQ